MKLLLLLLLSTSTMAGTTLDRRLNLAPLDKFFNTSLDKLKSRRTELATARAYRNGADYRYRDTEVKQQFGGTCTAFGGIAAIENLLDSPSMDLSERDAWSKYKQYSVEAFVNALTKEGNEVCTENEWHQDDEEPRGDCASNRRWRLGSTTYLSNNIELALDVLDKGSVVYIGLNTPEDMLECRTYIRPTSDFADGGHAVLIVGYHMDSQVEGGGFFIIKNSWGTSCGDKGYQYLPFHICQRTDGYCLMWEFQNTLEKTPTVIISKYKTVTTCKRLWWTLWLKKRCTTKKVLL